MSNENKEGYLPRATILILTLLVTACGGGDDDAAQAAQSQAPPPPVAAEPPLATAPPAPTPDRPPAESPPVEPPVDEEPKGYSVDEIVIQLPNAKAWYLGDDGSVAGDWTTFDATEWREYVDGSIFVLKPDGTLRNFADLESEPASSMNEAESVSSMNERLAHYEGHFAAGYMYPRHTVGVGVAPESYILDAEAETVSLTFLGYVSQLLSSGEAVGTDGLGTFFPLSDRAFYWNGELMRTVPFIHDAQLTGSRAWQIRDGKIYGTIGFGDAPEDQEQVFVWHLMKTGPDVVMVYPPGDPNYSIEPDPELPAADSLHELIDKEDWWFGRLTFTSVLDVNSQGLLLAEGCAIEGCASFVLSPPP
jgi:hypothetical protein